jgi:hypothetical protein
VQPADFNKPYSIAGKDLVGEVAFRPWLLAVTANGLMAIAAWVLFIPHNDIFPKKSFKNNGTQALINFSFALIFLFVE